MKEKIKTMETPYDKIINFWAILTMIALITSAISLFFFRYYSGKKSKYEFNSVRTKISDEVEKSINEISATKTAINEKLKSEGTQIITQLKQKADETNEALESVIQESNKMTEQINTDLKSFKTNAEKELLRISRPLGSKFKVNGFRFDLEIDDISDFDKQYKSSEEFNKHKNPVDSRFDFSGVDFNGFQVSETNLPEELEKLLKERISYISLTLIKNLSDDMKDISKIMGISFKVEDVSDLQIMYRIFKKPDREYYEVSLVNEKKESHNVHKYIDVYSKDDICNKYVLASITIDNSVTRVLPYNIKLSSMSLKDEFNNNFLFTPIENIGILNGDMPIKELQKMKTLYTLGKLECLN